eukprot:GEZU01029910.1.p1 GENE.GEZU01029910.1~~GEZU01029910.1.p1  ORF type:complete len:139 (-),score=21.80 GEZU01029910.1:272-688(-)
MSNIAALALVGISIFGAVKAGRYLLSTMRRDMARTAVSTAKGAAKFLEGGFEPVMTKKEASDILGLTEKASVAQIKEAHRRLMMLNHPDTGGSEFISTKINEAKDLMLKGSKKSVAPEGEDTSGGNNAGDRTGRRRRG